MSAVPSVAASGEGACKLLLFTISCYRRLTDVWLLVFCCGIQSLWNSATSL